jgi:predicted RNA binding protein YcfA (HicA-like mRNA interferase family)
VTDIPSVSFRVLIRKIKQLGFEAVRQKGSHIRFIHPDGRKTTIPDHGNRDVPQGLFIRIVR